MLNQLVEMAFWIRICNTDILHNTLPLDCTHRACLTGKWCSVTPPWYLYNSLTSDSQHATDGKANVHVFIWHVFFFMGLIHSALFPVFLNNNVWTHCNTKKSNNKEIIQNAQLKGTDEVRCKMLCSEKKKKVSLEMSKSTWLVTWNLHNWKLCILSILILAEDIE